ncbi:macrophage activating glycoprotein [Moniliophthora roreri]|nr:macrophage activating glycoprotein [Moniliophthora roreri]
MTIFRRHSRLLRPATATSLPWILPSSSLLVTFSFSPASTTMYAISILAFSSFVFQATAQYSATFSPDNLPDQTQQGQSGTNKCGTKASQTSDCQNAYINSVEDFCLFAPPKPGPDSVIGNTEREEVSWCLKDGYGTRLIPDGTIKGAHFVKTPDYVQVTGIGDFTSMNIPAGDAGGELDPHGADGNGNPIGGLVFSSAFGPLQQIHEWTNFMAVDQFCFRACNPAGKDPAAMCQHIYDVMGCAWNMPASYDAGTFENCDGNSGEPMGVYGGSTFHQGEPNTPPPHPAPASSNCKKVATISNGLVSATHAANTTSAKPTSAPLSTGKPTSTSPTGSAANAETTGNAAFTLMTGGWERVLYTVGSIAICSLIGAAVLL